MADPSANDLTDSDESGAQADAALAKRCLAGEVAAWEELHAQCHQPLTVSIRVMLGLRGGDLNLVDEIAASVWYALVADDGALLARYHPDRGGRLITFMRALAKDEIGRQLRSELRRRKRESRAARKKSKRTESHAEETRVSLSEFLLTLTPAERAFADSYLLSEPQPGVDSGASDISTGGIWQLTSRIRRKFLGFFGR